MLPVLSASSPGAGPSEPAKRRLWTAAEDDALKEAIRLYGSRTGAGSAWSAISRHVSIHGGRTNKVGRSYPCGHSLTKKDCRKRWFYTLDPGLKKGRWTQDEDEALRKAFLEVGAQWKEMGEQQLVTDMRHPAENQLCEYLDVPTNRSRSGGETYCHPILSSTRPGRPRRTRFFCVYSKSMDRSGPRYHTPLRRGMVLPFGIALGAFAVYGQVCPASERAERQILLNRIQLPSLTTHRPTLLSPSPHPHPIPSSPMSSILLIRQTRISLC